MCLTGSSYHCLIPVVYACIIQIKAEFNIFLVNFVLDKCNSLLTLRKTHFHLAFIKDHKTMLQPIIINNRPGLLGYMHHAMQS